MANTEYKRQEDPSMEYTKFQMDFYVRCCSEGETEVPEKVRPERFRVGLKEKVMGSRDLSEKQINFSFI